MVESGVPTVDCGGVSPFLPHSSFFSGACTVCTMARRRPANPRRSRRNWWARCRRNSCRWSPSRDCCLWANGPSMASNCSRPLVRSDQCLRTCISLLLLVGPYSSLLYRRSRAAPSLLPLPLWSRQWGGVRFVWPVLSGGSSYGRFPGWKEWSACYLSPWVMVSLQHDAWVTIIP